MRHDESECAPKAAKRAREACMRVLDIIEHGHKILDYYDGLPCDLMNGCRSDEMDLFYERLRNVRDTYQQMKTEPASERAQPIGEAPE